MELHQMKYVSYVAKYGSVAKASDELYVSRQAISKAIRSLEHEIGYEIFDRANGMQPTMVGKGAIDRINALLDKLDEFDAYTSSKAEGASSPETLSLALTAFPLDYLYFNSENEVISLINEFAARTPDCDLKTYQLPDAAILSALQSGTIDIGFVHGAYEREGLKSLPLMPVEMRVIILKSNPLASKQSIKIPDLEGVPIRSPLDFNLFYCDLIAQCRRYGFEPTFCEVPLNDESIYAFIEEGGVHLQPYDPSMKREFPDNVYLAFHPNDRNDLPLCLVYKEHSDKAHIPKFVSYVRNNLRQ